MINVCHDFASEYGVVFNPKKTVCMLFGCTTIPNGIDMSLGREKLIWADSIRHLSNIVSPDLKDDINFQLKGVISLDL